MSTSKNLKKVETPKTNAEGELHKSPKGGGPKRYGTIAKRVAESVGREQEWKEKAKTASSGLPCGMLPMLKKVAQFQN